MPFSSFGANQLASVRSWKRKWAVTIDTFKTTELDIKFKIEKSLKDEPNKCELEILNLSEEHRARIEELTPFSTVVSGLAKQKVKIAARKAATSGIPVKIEAGYEEDDDLSLLWLGDLRNAISEREGANWVTKLESGDGEKAWQNARVNLSYGPKTPVATVIRAIARELGLGEGNLASVIASIELNGVGRLLPRGAVIAGPARQQLRDWTRSAGLEFSIQDGALQFLEKGKATGEQAFLVSAETGMIGSPTVDIDGLVHVKMLMPHGIRPGRLLVIDSQRVAGGYKAEKIIYEGDTAGDEWFVEMEAVRY